MLGKHKRGQVIALGRLEWSLRRVEAAVHIRRETIGEYLRAAFEKPFFHHLCGSRVRHF
jgi:hypothetical protein